MTCWERNLRTRAKETLKRVIKVDKTMEETLVLLQDLNLSPLEISIKHLKMINTTRRTKIWRLLWERTAPLKRKVLLLCTSYSSRGG
jgi:hypothetical protein